MHLFLDIVRTYDSIIRNNRQFVVIRHGENKQERNDSWVQAPESTIDQTGEASTDIGHTPHHYHWIAPSRVYIYHKTAR